MHGRFLLPSRADAALSQVFLEYSHVKGNSLRSAAKRRSPAANTRVQISGLDSRLHCIQSLGLSFPDLITEDATFGMMSKEVLVAKISEDVPTRIQFHPSHQLPSG